MFPNGSQPKGVGVPPGDRDLIPLVMGVMFLALLALRWLLVPLVVRLERSETQARE